MDSQAHLLRSAEQSYQSGELAEAEAVCQTILASEPRHAQALHLLAAIALRQNNPQRATQLLATAMNVAVDSAELHNELGNLWQSQGQIEQAVACFERARQLLPSAPQIHFNLGNALRAAGNTAAAEASYREALRVAPRFAPACNNLGTLRQSLGDLRGAESCYQGAVQIEPRYAEAHFNLGVLREKLGDLAGAQVSYERAIAIDPHHARALNNLGAVHLARERWDEARQCFQEASRAAPQYAEPQANLGVLAIFLGKYAEARELLSKSLELDPTLASAHYNLGMLLLLHGEFEAGWRHYAWHERSPRLGAREFSQPAWDGSPLEGRTILVHCDHGLGDTLHFVRYVDEIRRRGAGKIWVAAQERLHSLLAESGYGNVLCVNTQLPQFDVHASVLGLPGAIRDTFETIADRGPYLRAKPELVSHWRRELEAGGRRLEAAELRAHFSSSSLQPAASSLPFRVGIFWRGAKKISGPDWRSIPLSEFAPLARVPGICLISLQVGPGSEEIRALAGRVDVVELGDDVDRPLEAFMDTAAIIHHLDLVITCDSSIAHLAGGLGAPVWVALPSAPDWRWFLDREDSPWYPTMRLFRQATLGDWKPPFARMAAELERLVQARRA